ncbi:AUGMIN subunit 6 [Canna indica]|uniref:AUGMIN subunit 6 n=1 Tax=Canna indica TaxID=4628 RepID=A0AAQ3KTI6_9LILI|nr:AUGMIN subunit 6 [Canna indica]
MATEREKEREAELESAMYTNCLLLGLDPAVLGMGVGGGGPRVGHFRHSNPKLGEQLLYFLLCALRGSTKDFDKVWPIFDSAQSRDFRKIVQGIISELESQGVLPRSNSRVSSLATCCGPRFVELLWQLSVHALREVHKRTFSADVASNPLPPALTDASYQNAAALLPVTKARIALERRRFLKNANAAVHRQTTWSDLAHEMTAEFRGLCAEEAYLQQELEKLQDIRNKAKSEGEFGDDRISSSSGQNSHLIAKATRLWESLLARKSQHEVLASGPIEDLIAHREHRYRISGSSLLAAMDLSSHVPYSDVLSVASSEISSSADIREQMESPHFQGKSESMGKMVDRGGIVHPTVDVAEILRRWTHALQRIHKQSLHLVKANDGEGPELLRSSSDNSTGGHAESLAATLAEHRQHLVSIQGLISQLKEAIPTMQKTIADLTEEVESISSTTVDGFDTRTLNMQSQVPQDIAADEIVELNSRLSSVQLDKVSTSPVLKLPHLISAAPNSSGKSMQTPKRSTITPRSIQETLPVGTLVAPQHASDHMDSAAKEDDIYDIQNIRRSVRESALSRPSSNSALLKERSKDDGSQHFFMPLSTGASHKEVDGSTQGKQSLVFSPPGYRVPRNSKDIFSTQGHLDSTPILSNKSHELDECTNQKSLITPDIVNPRNAFLDIDDDALDQVFSPPLLMESSFFQDTYEDLLAPLSETDAALMDH